MKQISTIHLTSVPLPGLDAVQLEVRFCSWRRKTDDHKCGQSRKKSGYFDCTSPMALLLSINEGRRTDSPSTISSGTDLRSVSASVRLSTCCQLVLFEGAGQ